MSVLIASPVRQSADVLRVVLPSWGDQVDGKGRRLDIEALVIDDNQYAPDSIALREGLFAHVDKAGTIIPSDTVLCVSDAGDYTPPSADETTHYWDRGAFRRIALLRNALFERAALRTRCLDNASTPDVTGVLLVDSDVVLAPRTVDTLRDICFDLHGPAVMLSAIYWTKFTPGSPEMPNVWDYHPYDFSGKGRITELRGASTPVNVNGLGAITYIPWKTIWNVFNSPIGLDPFSPIESLRKVLGDWEDKHFCVKMNVLFDDCLYAVQLPKGADVLHLYRPSDLERVAQWQKEQSDAAKALILS